MSLAANPLSVRRSKSGPRVAGFDWWTRNRTFNLSVKRTINNVISTTYANGWQPKALEGNDGESVFKVETITSLKSLRLAVGPGANTQFGVAADATI